MLPGKPYAASAAIAAEWLLTAANAEGLAIIAEATCGLPISACIELALSLPAVAADPLAPLIAPGFSCRSQVHGLAGVEALHPVELLSTQLESPPPGRAPARKAAQATSA